MVAVNTHGAVAVVTMKWAAGSIDRDQMVIHTEPVALGVTVGKQAPSWNRPFEQGDSKNGEGENPPKLTGSEGATLFKTDSSRTSLEGMIR